MREEMFKELLKSVRQAGAIMSGETEPSRVFEVEAPDVKSIRAKFGVSQHEFASLLGIRVRALENWEHKRRIPKGLTRVLLQGAAAHPEAVWDVVRHEKKSQRQAV
jgi:putative transcriptional regulator